MKAIRTNSTFIFCQTRNANAEKIKELFFANATKTEHIMKTEKKTLQLILLCCLTCALTFGQVQMPTAPQPNQFQQYGMNGLQNPTNPNIAPNPLGNLYNDGQDRIRRQNQQIIAEVERNEQLRAQKQNQLNEDIAEFNSNHINYSLPSYGNIESTKYYRETFEKLNQTDPNNFSVKDLNFHIENAYFENQQDKAEFDRIIKNIGEFIAAKMEEQHYDPNSNSDKNFMLFQFFADTLQLKDGTQHLPFKYDFEDYMGIKDYSKMFVSKLLATQTGQCHSMPLLYLILAEEINAEAYLAYSPNHSYIRFPADNGKWYDVELTNGMFSTPSYVLNSGFIKSEALQNKIYMQSLSDKQLLSQLYTDLAGGYIAKYGYDEFSAKVISKALELYPNNIFANLTKGNIDAKRLQYVLQQLGINPNIPEDRNKIRNYPQAMAVLQEANYQHKKIDNLGYTYMPDEAYQNWLQSMKEQKSKQDNQAIKEQFKGLIENKQPKN